MYQFKVKSATNDKRIITEQQGASIARMGDMTNAIQNLHG